MIKLKNLKKKNIFYGLMAMKHVFDCDFYSLCKLHNSLEMPSQSVYSNLKLALLTTIDIK